MIETHFSSNASSSLSRRGLDRSFILPVQLPFPHSLANSLQSVTQEDAVVVVVGKSHFYRFVGGWLRCAREPTKNKNSNPGPCLQCQWNKQLCTHREIYRQTDATQTTTDGFGFWSWRSPLFWLQVYYTIIGTRSWVNSGHDSRQRIWISMDADRVWFYIHNDLWFGRTWHKKQSERYCFNFRIVWVDGNLLILKIQSWNFPSHCILVGSKICWNAAKHLFRVIGSINLIINFLPEAQNPLSNNFGIINPILPSTLLSIKHKKS